MSFQNFREKVSHFERSKSNLFQFQLMSATQTVDFMNLSSRRGSQSLAMLQNNQKSYPVLRSLTPKADPLGKSGPADFRKNLQNRSNIHPKFQTGMQSHREADWVNQQQPRTIKQQEYGYQFLSDGEQKIIQLKERLKNLHHFYRIRIEEQRGRNLSRNEVFIGIIEQLQRNHNERIKNGQSTIKQLEGQREELGSIDERVKNIKNTVEQILNQSVHLKQANGTLEHQIMQKQVVIKEKQVQLVQSREQLDAMRGKLEQFERMKLKEHKRNKQIQEMIAQQF